MEFGCATVCVCWKNNEKALNTWRMAMKEFSIFFGVMVLWIVLNRWVLPWFGIQTCMSGGCSAQNAPSCCAEPLTQGDKDALEAKGEQK
jgi:hypothetical protein